jgi:hypothetical protein
MAQLYSAGKVLGLARLHDNSVPIHSERAQQAEEPASRYFAERVENGDPIVSCRISKWCSRARITSLPRVSYKDCLGAAINFCGDSACATTFRFRITKPRIQIIALAVPSRQAD